MKLNELLKKIFDEKSIAQVGYLDNISLENSLLDYKKLSLIKEQLLECDEFKNVEELIMIKDTVYKDNIGNPFFICARLLNNELSFSGKCYIHSIAIGPQCYGSPADFEPVKDGVFITPVVYDHLTFEPKRRICIEFSPEGIQDELVNNVNKKEEELIMLFKKVLSSPDEYTIKGQQTYIIRGIFSETTYHGKKQINNIGELDLNNPYFDAISSFSVQIK